MNEKGIIFDLDGTLWDASTQVVPAWNNALNRYSELDKQITIDDMRGFMGKTIDVIAEIMFPGMDSEKRISFYNFYPNLRYFSVIFALYVIINQKINSNLSIRIDKDNLY